MSYYRVLRDGEDYTQGLVAAIPTAQVSVENHVLYGSSCYSQYISACRSLYAAEVFVQKRPQRPKTIVAIDIQQLKLLPYVEIIDLYGYPFQTQTAVNYANKFEEVLIVGQVPAACVSFCKQAW